MVTNVEADHLDHYGSFAAVRSAFEEFVAGARATGWWAATTPVAAGHRAGGRGRRGRASDAGCTYRIVDLDRWPAARSPSTWSVRTGDRAGPPGGARCPGSTTPATPRWPRWPPWPPGVPFDAAARALARFAGVARRFEFRGDGRRGHLRRRLRPPAQRGRAPPWPRPATATGAGWWPCSSPTATAGRRSSASEFGEAFGDADVVVVTDVYGAGEAPVPGGLRAAGGRRRPAVASRTCRCSTCPAAPTCVRTVADLLEAGDLCLTLGAGDLTSLPDELLADPGW